MTFCRDRAGEDPQAQFLPSRRLEQDRLAKLVNQAQIHLESSAIEDRSGWSPADREPDRKVLGQQVSPCMSPRGAGSTGRNS